MPQNGEKDGRRSSLVLGPKDRLKGSLFVEGDLVVVGTVDGELEATGDVEIDGGGKVSGPVTARNRLVVGASGSLVGDVRVARLIVQDGANFTGNVSMVKPGDMAKARVVEAAPAPIVEATPAVTEAAAPEAPKAAEASAPPATDGAVPPAAEAPTAKPAGKSDGQPAKSEAWQTLRSKGGKPNDRKGRHR